MSQQGDGHGSQQDDWWRQLYDEDGASTAAGGRRGGSSAPGGGRDSLDAHFDSALNAMSPPPPPRTETLKLRRPTPPPPPPSWRPPEDSPPPESGRRPVPRQATDAGEGAPAAPGEGGGWDPWASAPTFGRAAAPGATPTDGPGGMPVETPSDTPAGMPGGTLGADEPEQVETPAADDAPGVDEPNADVRSGDGGAPWDVWASAPLFGAGRAFAQGEPDEPEDEPSAWGAEAAPSGPDAGRQPPPARPWDAWVTPRRPTAPPPLSAPAPPPAAESWTPAYPPTEPAEGAQLGEFGPAEGVWDESEVAPEDGELSEQAATAEREAVREPASDAADGPQAGVADVEFAGTSPAADPTPAPPAAQDDVRDAAAANWPGVVSERAAYAERAAVPEPAADTPWMPATEPGDGATDVAPAGVDGSGTGPVGSRDAGPGNAGSAPAGTDPREGLADTASMPAGEAAGAGDGQRDTPDWPQSPVPAQREDARGADEARRAEPADAAADRLDAVSAAEEATGRDAATGPEPAPPAFPARTESGFADAAGVPAADVADEPESGPVAGPAQPASAPAGAVGGTAAAAGWPAPRDAVHVPAAEPDGSPVPDEPGVGAADEFGPGRDAAPASSGSACVAEVSGADRDAEPPAPTAVPATPVAPPVPVMPDDPAPGERARVGETRYGVGEVRWAPELPPGWVAAEAGAEPEVVGGGPPTYGAEPTAWPAADPERLDELVPDTVLDGAQYGPLTLRTASVRGDSARYRGRPRGDALLTARFGDGADALLLVAAASGARGSDDGHRAAQDAVRWIAGAVGRSRTRLAEDLAAGRRGALKSGLHRLTDRCYGRLRARGEDLGLADGTYTASLRCLLLPADPGCRMRLFFGAGDGGLFRVRDGQWQDLDLAPDATAVPFRFRATVARPGDALLMCTAGLAEPLRGEPELAAHLARRWGGGTAPGLAGYLADAQTRVKGYADDRTAVTVWDA